MMINLLYAFAGLLLLKLVINTWKYIQCKRYLARYSSWLSSPDWRLVEHRASVVRLLKDAGVSDSYRGVVEPLGFAQIRTTTASIMSNFPNTREDFVNATFGMFHEAIGVYRSRIWETFSPLYWVELIVHLPKKALAYLGASPESFLTKAAQVVWWIAASVVGFLYALYRTDIDRIVRTWLSRMVP